MIPILPPLQAHVGPLSEPTHEERLVMGVTAFQKAVVVLFKDISASEHQCLQLNTDFFKQVLDTHLSEHVAHNVSENLKTIIIDNTIILNQGDFEYRINRERQGQYARFPTLAEQGPQLVWGSQNSGDSFGSKKEVRRAYSASARTMRTVEEKIIRFDEDRGEKREDVKLYSLRTGQLTHSEVHVTPVADLLTPQL